MNIGIALALLLAQDVEILAPEFLVQQGKPQLRFKLKLSEGTLLGVDLLKAGVTSWTDDQGTTLGLKDPKEFYGDASVSTQGSGADLVVQILGKTPPAAGAKSMSIDADIPLRIGSELQEGEAKEVELKPGASFEVGPYAFKVAKIETARDSIDFKLQEIRRVTFSFDSPRQLTTFDVLKEFKFLTEDGKVHPSAQRNFQGSFKEGGEHRLTVALVPFEGPLTVKWAVYGKIEGLTVPVKHEGPIGTAK